MIHSKTIDVLKTFTKEELKQFSDFVRSPFHNKNKNLIKLFDELKKYHPEFEIENEKIYSKVYPGKSYHHDNMRKFMSEMLRLIDNFLSLIGMRKEKFISEKFILQELLTREADDYFLLRMKNFEKEFSEIKNLQYKDMSDLEDLRIDFYLSHNAGKDTTEFSNKKFIYDTCYFFFQIFEYLNSIISQKNTYNGKNSNPDIIFFIRNLDFDSSLKVSGRETEEGKMLYLLSNLIKMNLYTERESFFFEAKKIFLYYFNSLNNEIPFGFMAYFAALTSYCIRKIRTGKLKYIFEEFELIKYRLESFNKLKNKMTAITVTDFSNAVHIGLYLDEIKWVEEFITKSKQNIHVNDYDYLNNYGKGYIEFQKANFEKALEYFSRIYVKEHLLNISVRHLTLMCYYELSLFEPAIMGIDSYSHLIHDSHKFNLRNKSLSKYFIDIYRDLLRLKQNPSKINSLKINKINIMLKSKEFTFTDKWFMKKSEELKLLNNKQSILKINHFNKNRIRLESDYA